jgi:hypothetical protein
MKVRDATLVCFFDCSKSLPAIVCGTRGYGASSVLVGKYLASCNASNEMAMQSVLNATARSR